MQHSAKMNFERFERTRREKLAQQQAAYERQQAERKHIQSFIDRFRYKASKARQAQSRCGRRRCRGGVRCGGRRGGRLWELRGESSGRASGQAM